MNVERMYPTLSWLHNQLEEEKVLVVFKNTISHLSNSVNQPQQANHQKNFTATLEDLKKILRESPVNNLDAGKQRVIEFIYVDEYIGNTLLSDITRILSENQITPSIAHKRLQKLYENVAAVYDALDKFIYASDIFHIEPYEAEFGECEFGALIPRSAIDNEVKGLVKDLNRIDNIMRTFNELTTGDASSCQIKSISTTDPLFYWAIGIYAAKVLGDAATKILETYKTVLEIRTLRKGLKDHGMTDTDLKAIDKKSNAVMEKAIDELAPKLVEKYKHQKLAKARKNELTVAVKSSLNIMANSIDKGIDFEININSNIEESEHLSEYDLDSINHVASVNLSIDFERIADERILNLPEPKDQESSDD